MNQYNIAWPDAATEKTMLEDASLLESEFAPTSTGHDAACHIKALLSHVRYLQELLMQDEGVMKAMQTVGTESVRHMQEAGAILCGTCGLPRVARLIQEQAQRQLLVLSKARWGQT